MNASCACKERSRKQTFFSAFFSAPLAARSTVAAPRSAPEMSVQERDPCPHRILDDIGGAFSMGAIGGGIWHTVKGARNSPRGERLMGSVTAVRARVPIIGGARNASHAPRA